jgi:hypothetical protein
MSKAGHTEQGRDLPMLKALWEHFTVDFPTPRVNLEGRTVLVTGGNAGSVSRYLFSQSRNTG